MRPIRVGIAYEGGIDAEIIAVWVRRILAEHSLMFDYFDPQTPSTAIVDFVPTYTRRFIEAGVDLAVFCTDQDKHPRSRKTEIEEKIKSVEEVFLLKSAIGVAVPHLEAWLFLQDHVVKNLLGYNPSQSLPHPTMQPKDRLLALYSDAPGDYEGSMAQLRIKIAEDMDIAQCARASSGFKHFIQSIRSAVGNL